MLYTFSGAAALDCSCSFKHGAHQDSVHEPQREKLPPPDPVSQPKEQQQKMMRRSMEAAAPSCSAEPICSAVGLTEGVPCCPPGTRKLLM